MVNIKYTIIHWIDEVYIKIQDAHIKNFQHNHFTSYIEMSTETGYIKNLLLIVWSMANFSGMKQEFSNAHFVFLRIARR